MERRRCGDVANDLRRVRTVYVQRDPRRDLYSELRELPCGFILSGWLKRALVPAWLLHSCRESQLLHLLSPRLLR